jgi:hypothetical protein
MGRATTDLFDGPGHATVGEGEVTVLKELLEPVVEVIGMQVELIAQVGNGELLEEVAFEDGNLLVVVERTARLVHGATSVQAKLTRTERFSRSY